VGDPALVAGVEQGNLSVSAAAHQPPAAAPTAGSNSTGKNAGEPPKKHPKTPEKKRSEHVNELVNLLFTELKEGKETNEDTAMAGAHSLGGQWKAADLVVEEKKKKAA